MHLYHRVGAGYDNIDIKDLGERGIAVANIPDYGFHDHLSLAYLSHTRNALQSINS